MRHRGRGECGVDWVECGPTVLRTALSYFGGVVRLAKASRSLDYRCRKASENISLKEERKGTE